MIPQSIEHSSTAIELAEAVALAMSYQYKDQDKYRLFLLSALNSIDKALNQARQSVWQQIISLITDRVCMKPNLFHVRYGFKRDNLSLKECILKRSEIERNRRRDAEQRTVREF